ncbi:Ig-like domain-containing protein [Pseudomonas sp. NPDC087817]|uniref:Ig-like domain-containing protein n=1 Tax=Pseudomonas sp. NPDC087817 TaxID=3364451 RepID=UPI00382629B4
MSTNDLPENTTLTVVNLNTATHPALIVDTSPLTLNGFNISILDSGLKWTAKGDPAETAADRSARGGVPPYCYVSSNERIASVDLNGIVRSEGNGKTTITVTDFAGQSKSFTVTTSNVSRYLSTGEQYLPYKDYFPWTQSVGGDPLELSAIDKHVALLNIKYEAYMKYPHLWSHPNPADPTQSAVLRYDGNPHHSFVGFFMSNGGGSASDRPSICISRRPW